MKVVLQRVSNASVFVNDEVVGSIDHGLCLLVGIHESDTEEDVEWICQKILNMRIFDDKEGKMNHSVQDVEGELLVISQFTLYGDASKGNRPSFTEAAGPEKARRLYDEMIHYFKTHSERRIQTGIFGAYMEVQLVNDGPVTILLDK